MKLTIHRGTHEIGGSCVEVKSRNSRIVIDIGLPLVTPSGATFDFSNYYRKLSCEDLIDLKILPNVKGLYGPDRSNKLIDGLLISHAHVDHYGLYNFVNKNIRYYLGETTHKLINLSNIFLEDRGFLENVTYIQDRTLFHIGDFKITPFLMDHSAFDAYSFLIEADGKKLFYSGDFRSHGRKRKLFYKFLRTAPKGINAMLLEGTLIKETTSRSKALSTEESVEYEIVSVLKKYKTIVFGMASAQNIDRMVSFYKAAKKNRAVFCNRCLYC